MVWIVFMSRASCRRTMKLTSGAPASYNMELNRHRGVECSDLVGPSLELTISRPLPVPDREVEFAGRDVLGFDLFPVWTLNLDSENEFHGVIRTCLKLPVALKHVAHVVKSGVHCLLDRLSCVGGRPCRQGAHSLISTVLDEVIAKGISGILGPLERVSSPILVGSGIQLCSHHLSFVLGQQCVWDKITLFVNVAKTKFIWVQFRKLEPMCQERPKAGLQDNRTTGMQDQRMRGLGRCEWKPDRGCRFEDWQGERRGAKRWEEWEEWEGWETGSVERKAGFSVGEAMEDGGVLRARG